MEIVFWIYFVFTACYAVIVATDGSYTFRKKLTYVLFSPFSLPAILLFLALCCLGLLLHYGVGENK